MVTPVLDISISTYNRGDKMCLLYTADAADERTRVVRDDRSTVYGDSILRRRMG